MMEQLPGFCHFVTLCPFRDHEVLVCCEGEEAFGEQSHFNLCLYS